MVAVLSAMAITTFVALVVTVHAAMVSWNGKYSLVKVSS